MKVILSQNVTDLGQEDDIKEVNPGYFRNFLLPQKLAILATPKLIEAAAKRKEEKIKQKEEKEKKILDALEQIKEKPITLKAKADETGTLFKSVGKGKIADAIKEKTSAEIPADMIELEKPIKKIGFYEIPIKNIVVKLEIKEEKEKAKKRTKTAR